MALFCLNLMYLSVCFGGFRIEDLCVMENGKTKLLSKSPKHLIEL